MRVQDVALIYQGGASVEWIVEHYDLTPAQVHAALAYYYDHKAEIDQDIAASQAVADKLLAEGKATLASDLKKKIERRRHNK